MRTKQCGRFASRTPIAGLVAGIVWAAAAMGATCSGCLYTLIPAQAGPSTTYQQAFAPQASNVQSKQQQPGTAENPVKVQTPRGNP